MRRIVGFLYSVLTKKIIDKLGKTTALKGVRDVLLRNNNNLILSEEKVEWGKGVFYFKSPIKIAVKAKKYGIESKLLRNTIKLLNESNINTPSILVVGANFGFISFALQTNLNDSKIYSFEPHSNIFEVFRNSIKKNNIKNIISHNFAIGSKDCQIKLNLAEQSSNILESNANVSKTVMIQQIALDEFPEKNNIIPNFIKIDVDGYELEVLKGLENAILKYKPMMVVETNDDVNILEFLKNKNYRLLNLDLEEFDDVPNNVFCV